MNKRFELFVALRYLKAKRKQAVISLITLISILGVAAGVMALVVALAINNGFRNTLQRSLLGATAHVTILEREPLYGIENWQELAGKLRALPHVRAVSAALYGQVFITGLHSEGAVLKGINLEQELQAGEVLRHLRQGSAEALKESRGYPGIIVGSRLAQKTGLLLNSVATVMSPQGELTPFGPRPKVTRFRVVGIFETGLYDFDAGWAFTTLEAAQQILSLKNVVNAIELRLDDIYRAPEVSRAAEKIAGPDLAATHWMEQNRQLFNALRMEKAVTVITIGLIELVAALNIFITLTMMVMEKYRDIAVLMSMGARREQIRRIFVYQGLTIGVVGVALGLAAGHLLCWLGERYRWVRLDEEIYSLSYVPFEPRWLDSIWIAGAALLVSYVATLYPSRNATRIAPAEALRYE